MCHLHRVTTMIQELAPAILRLRKGGGQDTRHCSRLPQVKAFRAGGGVCVHERAQASPCVCRHLCEVSRTCMLGDVSPLGSRRYLWACSAPRTCMLLLLCYVYVSVHTSVAPSLPLRGVSVYTCVCTCMLVSASPCLTCEALRAALTVLGPWEPMMDLKLCF